jgi:hypothetical protein
VSTAYCTALGRVEPNYTYPCTVEAFGNGQYDYCQVGDTSGKFGKLFAADTTNLLFSADEFDGSPALIPDYETASQLSNQWASVVVHCGSSRILCAKFLPVSESATCGNYEPASATQDEDDDTTSEFLDLSKTAGALLWSGVIVVVALGGLFVGYKFLHSTTKADGGEGLLSATY